MSEALERMAGTVAALEARLAQLERLVDMAERGATAGRPRYMMWGTLEAELPAGGAVDVQLKARVDGEWVDRWIMEDVPASPLQPADTCLASGLLVCVAWFPLDEECYVIGAETCPADCASASSS